MFDSDFERTKEFLRGKLPDYLRSRGIKPEEPFNCLNPLHPDHRLCMSYNPHSKCVQCYGCNANYDLFALIGLDYGLTDFNAQYNKACELFLGKNPVSVHERPLNFENAGAATFGLRKEPTFELKRDNFEVRADRPERTGAAPSFTPLYPPRAPTEIVEGFKHQTPPAANFSPEREDKSYSSQPAAGGAVFGLSSNHYRQNSNTFISSSNERNYPELSEGKYNYADYLRQVAAKASHTEFFKYHGLSDDIVSRFHLGYDESFAAGADAHTGEQILWRAVIFPYSDFGYTVYNCDAAARDKYRKRGVAGIFNEEALQYDGPIFICDDELDALTLESLNFHALTLATPAAAHTLLEQCAKTMHSERIFYICIHEVGAGAECVKALCAGFYNLKIPFKKVDAAFPYGSLNEALLEARDKLTYRLKHLEEMLTFTTTPVVRQSEEYFLIEDPASLSRLQLSPYLYALCAPCTVLRRTLRLIMQERLCQLYTVTTPTAWQFICHELDDSATGNNTILTFESFPNARAVLLKNTTPPEALEEINYALCALRMQKESNFTLVIDMTVFAPQDHAELMRKLQTLSQELNCGLLLLCPLSDEEWSHSLCVQSLHISQSEDGNELIFKSSALNGRPLNFTRYAEL